MKISDESHPNYLSDEQLLKGCRITFGRASGPGGQNRNKVETAVDLMHLATQVVASASEKRTQRENRDVAVFRLRLQLAIHVRSIPNPIFSTVWDKYLASSGTVNISDTNPDWPIVLTELLNWSSCSEWDFAVVAKQLKTSTSQLVKLLKKYRPAFGLANQIRQHKGLRTLQ